MKKTAMELDHTMNQLKDALERWQEITPRQIQNNSPAEGAELPPDWLRETRELLEQLNQQLDELSI